MGQHVTRRKDRTDSQADSPQKWHPKTRGAGYNPGNRFSTIQREDFDDGWGAGRDEERGASTSMDMPEDPAAYWHEIRRDPKTEVLTDHSRTIVSTNQSPDIAFSQSINAYKGCEHGCVYCYARPSHEYLDLSLGIDFESKLFYKPAAGPLLEKFLARRNYQCQTIALGTNTDPYQPLEREKGITRELLSILLQHRHPVSIVTKGSLILRDLDLLTELAQHQLVSVMISITTLDRDLKRTMEPRAAAPGARLAALEQLRRAGVPAGVMVAPVIPFINDNEMERIVSEAAARGARHANYVMLRLPYQLKELFEDWLERYYPQRKSRVLNILREMRGGELYQADFGSRMRGTGVYAELFRKRFGVIVEKHRDTLTGMPDLRTDLFHVPGAARQGELDFESPG